MRTGQVADRSGRVRVKIEFARDLGDAAGTLVFDQSQVGGRAPAAMFSVA